MHFSLFSIFKMVRYTILSLSTYEYEYMCACYVNGLFVLHMIAYPIIPNGKITMYPSFDLNCKICISDCPKTAVEPKWMGWAPIFM